MIDPKVKAAMTREFNSGGHAVKVCRAALAFSGRQHHHTAQYGIKM